MNLSAQFMLLSAFSCRHSRVSLLKGFTVHITGVHLSQKRLNTTQMDYMDSRRTAKACMYEGDEKHCPCLLLTSSNRLYVMITVIYMILLCLSLFAV